MDVEFMKDHLTSEEGRVRHAYKDHLGYLTIGVGHMVDERLGGGLPEPIIDALLEYDITAIESELDRNATWWRAMPEGVQNALAAMSFQLGWPRLSKFKNMLASMEAGEYGAAADHALDSKWAREDTPERAARVATMIRGS